MKFNLADATSPAWTEGDTTNTYWLNQRGELIGEKKYSCHVSVAWRQAYVEWHEGLFKDANSIVFSIAGASPNAMEISSLERVFPQDAIDISDKKKYLERIMRW